MTKQSALDTDLLAIAAGHGLRGSACDELAAAYDVRVPHASARGLRLGDLVDGGAAEWIAWAVRRPAGFWPVEFERALRLVAYAWFPGALTAERS